MSLQFNATQLAQIQTAYNSAKIAAAGGVVGAYASAYELIFSMISDNVGGLSTAKAGVDAGAWALLRGVPDVNRGVGDYSTWGYST